MWQAKVVKFKSGGKSAEKQYEKIKKYTNSSDSQSQNTKKLPRNVTLLNENYYQITKAKCCHSKVK